MVLGAILQRAEATTHCGSIRHRRMDVLTSTTHVLVSDHSSSACGWPSQLVNERARHICKVTLGGLGWLVKRAVGILARR
jgi:hypothetical protein